MKSLPGRIERRLAAILAVDVAGYSRLMGEDEEGTLAALRTVRRELADPKIAEHRGRIVKTTGDGLLSEFASVVDAVRCAVEVQREMAERNTAVRAERRIEFRMGINVGDIMIEDGDIFGDGVNIAARLEALAEPGGICLSAAAHEQVRDRLDLAFDDLGEQQVKNITRPVRVFCVTLTHPVPAGQARGLAADTVPGSPLARIAGEGAKRQRHEAGEGKPALALPEKPSIAVLPFQNLTSDPEQDYFTDGMVEEIITGLSRIKWLFVIARNSTFVYKGKSVDVKQVGQELGVRYVLEGSVRRAAGRVRITGQLVQTQSRKHIWAERYDRALDDVFALQDEITLSVVGAIEPSLRQAEMERVKRKRPEDLDAYDLVLRARPYVDTAMPEGALKALPLLKRALALEPDYALAHGHAARCYHQLYVRAGKHEEDRQEAIRHARAALAHGGDDAAALAEGAFVIAHHEQDQAAAREALETAVSLSPSLAFAYTMGAIVFGWGGEAESAIEWGQRALRLSPLDPHAFGAWHGLGIGFFIKGHYEDAASAERRAIQRNPGFSVLHLMLAAALVKLGRIDEAKAAAARLLALEPGFRIVEWLAATEPAAAIAVPLTEALRASGLPN